jgi:hypothetical protein
VVAKQMVNVLVENNVPNTLLWPPPSKPRNKTRRLP